MYKTVRKGDTSLQYTILPQTDQLASSGGCPQNPGKTSRPWRYQVHDESSTRCIKYMMGMVMVLIVVSILGAPVMMNQAKYDHMVHKMMTMRKVELLMNDTRSQTKDAGVGKNRSRIATTTTTSATEVTRTKDLEGDRTISSTLSGVLREEEEEEEEENVAVVDDATLTDTTEITTPQTTASTETSTSVRRTPTSPAAILPTILAASSAASRAPTTSGTTEDDTTARASRKKPEMPRVTLKLRENETIPHMYMKAGIASYKKGNITTSVLASDLSLEGLIFKTPEGTIRPWPQKWFFGDPTANFHWKSQTQTPLLILYIFVAGMSVLLIVSFFLTFYVQRKLSRRQRSNIEEPEVEEHEDDKSTLSTLLGSENQETELKE